MPTLMDLPNELLLPIIAHVSPLYFESFVLTCKRIHGLSAEAMREHKNIRSSLASLLPYELLQKVVSDPDLALYPKSLKIKSSISDGLELINRLPNIRRLEINADLYLGPILEAFFRILNAHHEPDGAALQQPFALNKLREIKIGKVTGSDVTTSLAILLCMIPSVRKLEISPSWRVCLYHPQLPNYGSGVTALRVWGRADLLSLSELIRRMTSLQNLSYHRM